MAGNPRKGTQTRPGDATGREKERLEREARPAIQEAATQVTLTTPPVVENVDEVVDYSGGGHGSAEEADAQAKRISVDEALADGNTQHTLDDLPQSALTAEQIADLPDGKTDTRPQTIVRTEEPQPAAQQPQVPQPVPAQQPQVATVEQPDVQPALMLMRVNTDLPDVTIGKDQHFTFRENTRYRVPKHVYDHLDEKGYVYH